MTQTEIKTGCMTALIQYYILSNNDRNDNIYISLQVIDETEWKKDTKNRMPDSINLARIHRANLPKTFKKDIREKQSTKSLWMKYKLLVKINKMTLKTF